MNLAWIEQTWIIVAAVIGGITLVWNFIHKTLKEISEQLRAPIVQIETKIDQVDAKVTEVAKQTTKITEATLTMQRNSLLRSCNDFLSRGYATINEKATIVEQYKSYHDLGGDSFITDMVEQVTELPLRALEVTDNRNTREEA